MTEGEPKEKADPTPDELGEWDKVFSGEPSIDAPTERNPAAGVSAELAKIMDERDAYLELARRTRADFENYQNRVKRDMEAERKYAASSLVAELLPVMDNLERALESAKKVAEAATIVEGLEIVKRQFSDALARQGVVAIKPEHETFDPNLHQAVMQQPSKDHPPMTVLFTVETGYKLNDRVIRPAKVIVSAAG
jgi:molecular chaperone GrpE